MFHAWSKEMDGFNIFRLFFSIESIVYFPTWDDDAGWLSSFQSGCNDQQPYYIYKHIIHNVGFYGSLSVSTGWKIGFWSANMEFNPMKGRWLVGLEEGFLGLRGSFAGVFHKQVKSQKACLIPSGRLIVVRTTVHLLLRMKLYSCSLNTPIEVSHLWILCYTVFFVGQFCFSQSVTSHKCIYMLHLLVLTIRVHHQGLQTVVGITDIQDASIVGFFWCGEGMQWTSASGWFELGKW